MFSKIVKKELQTLRITIVPTITSNFTAMRKLGTLFVIHTIFISLSVSF